MHLLETDSFALSPDQVISLMTSTEFQRRKAERLGAQHFEVDVTDNPFLTVVTRRTMATSTLPEFIKPMVNPTIQVVETERWHTVVDGVPTEGDFEVDVSGAPIKLRGKVTLALADERSLLSFEGDLRSSVPLFRQRIEESAAGSVLETIRTEFALLHAEAVAGWRS